MSQSGSFDTSYEDSPSTRNIVALSAGAVEYADCTSAEG